MALNFMYNNFSQVHKTLKATPAMGARAAGKIWILNDVVEVFDSYKHTRV